MFVFCLILVSSPCLACLSAKTTSGSQISDGIVLSKMSKTVVLDFGELERARTLCMPLHPFQDRDHDLRISQRRFM